MCYPAKKQAVTGISLDHRSAEVVFMGGYGGNRAYVPLRNRLQKFMSFFKDPYPDQYIKSKYCPEEYLYTKITHVTQNPV